MRDRTAFYAQAPSTPDEKCSVADCPRRRRSRGLCGKHYERLRKHGSATAPVHEWRGVPGYSAIHNYLRKQRGAASDYPCVDCGRQAKDWSLSTTNVLLDEREGLTYSLSLDDYLPRCGACHSAYDR